MAVVLMLALAAPLHAQEEQRTVPTILEQMVGPYQTLVQALPNPPTQGLLNLHATLKDPSTGEYVTDARVRVFAQRLESAERGLGWLLNSPAAPNSYSTQLNILEEGAWIFTFEVSGALGEGSAEVMLEVAKQPRSLAGWLAWAGMTLALLLVLGLAWRNANRVKRLAGR